jgi:hypothetical protein
MNAKGAWINTNCCQDIFLTKFIRKATDVKIDSIGGLTILNLNQNFLKFRNTQTQINPENWYLSKYNFHGNDYFKPHSDYKFIYGNSYAVLII